MSSSAALECAVACALDDLFGLGLSRLELAAFARRGEVEFVGVPCGIMDQLAVMLCEENSALLLDTRTLRTESLPLDLLGAGLALLVVDTLHPHALVDGRYASRRHDCEVAAGLLEVGALRDISLSELDGACGRLVDPELVRRLRHVVTENARVTEAARLLRAGQIRKIGPLLSQSHVSLRDDFDVTTPELDTAVASALRAGAYGARMVGAGFGGSAIALISLSSVDRVTDAVADAFVAHGLDPPAIWVAHPAGGAHRVAGAAATNGPEVLGRPDLARPS